VCRFLAASASAERRYPPIYLARRGGEFNYVSSITIPQDHALQSKFDIMRGHSVDEVLFRGSSF
jgi:hypothetical protein